VAARWQFWAHCSCCQAELVKRLQESGRPISDIVLSDHPAPSGNNELPDLAAILPPPEWLTRAQRRLWQQRTAAYLAEGWPRPAPEQEAMAELVMTGKLFDPSNLVPWPAT
jgi:hypothetical protein